MEDDTLAKLAAAESLAEEIMTEKQQVAVSAPYVCIYLCIRLWIMTAGAMPIERPCLSSIKAALKEVG